jgi:hypothetical protein
MRAHVVLQAIRQVIGATFLKEGATFFDRRPEIRRGPQLREAGLGMKRRRSNECITESYPPDWRVSLTALRAPANRA